MDLDPKYFVDFIAANIDNEKLSDEDFRDIVRDTIPLYHKPDQKEDELAVD